MSIICEKLTEIGMSEIIPVYCEKSAFKSCNYNHLERVIISAATQSHNGFLPQLKPLITFDQALTYRPVVLEPSAPTSFVGLMKSEEPNYVFIGPQSGFSNKELDSVVSSGLQTVTLGARVLRVETAAIIVSSLLQANYGDLS